jgi:hypothetical protein
MFPTQYSAAPQVPSQEPAGSLPVTSASYAKIDSAQSCLTSYSQKNSSSSGSSSGFFSDVWTKIVDFFKWLFCCCGMGDTTPSSSSNSSGSTASANTGTTPATGVSSITIPPATRSSSQAQALVFKAKTPFHQQVCILLEQSATEWFKRPPHPFQGTGKFTVKLLVNDFSAVPVASNQDFIQVLADTFLQLETATTDPQTLAICLSFESDQQMQQRTFRYFVANGAVGFGMGDAYVDKTVHIPAPLANQINQAMGFNNARTTNPSAVTGSTPPATGGAPTSAIGAASQARVFNAKTEYWGQVCSLLDREATEWFNYPTYPFQGTGEFRIDFIKNGHFLPKIATDRDFSSVLDSTLRLLQSTLDYPQAFMIRLTFESNQQHQARLFMYVLDEGVVKSSYEDLYKTKTV